MTAEIITPEGKKEKLRFNNLLACEEPSILDKPKMDLAICMMIKKEDSYRIPELVAYHSLVGVDKFFIYYNFKEDELMANYRHFFEPLVNSGLVDLVPFYFKTKSLIDGLQRCAYQDCLYKIKGRVKWLGFSDADEFFLLQPNSQFNSLVDFLNSQNNEWTSFAFRTFMAGYGGEAKEFFARKNSTLFLNEWLLFKDEHKLREPKSIYKTDENEYVGVHWTPAHRDAMLHVPWQEALLGHYRYPYKNFTIKGIQSGSYVKNTNFKELYGQKVLEKLHSLGFGTNLNS